MKFKDKLEALKWMTENTPKGVKFDLVGSGSDFTTRIDTDGTITDTSFFNHKAHNFRTEDDKLEIDWDKVKGQRKPELTCSEDACQMIKEYHAQLLPILEEKFGK